MDLSEAGRKVEMLLFPRNVVLVGANDRAGSWAARTWLSLAKYKFPGKVYPVNPRRDELFGVPCYRNIASIPEAPDHLVVVVPATSVADALRQGSAAGARSATILSAGFEEAGSEDGRRLADELRRVIEESGLAVSGPNCLGNICAKSSMATLSQDGQLTMSTGPVALVGQSGGVAIFVNRVLQDRGIDAGYIVSTGNETGLTIADYIAFFATEPDTKVILCYSEGIKDIVGFREACRLARANGKSIVMFKSGQSKQGREAALAHTGSLAGNIESFDAMANDIGAIRVDSFDDAVEVTELLIHSAVPAGRRLAGLSLSGAYRGMLHDAAARSDLSFPPLAVETTEKLCSLLSVGATIGNPLDGGFGILTSEDIYAACVEALETDPGVDALVIQEELPREPGGDRRGERYLRRVDNYVATKARKPVIYTTILSHGQSDYSRTLRRELPHLSFLHEPNKTLRALDLCIRRNQLEALATSPTPTPPGAGGPAAQEARRRVATTRGERVVLNEVESKALLREFDIPIGRERLATTADEAVRSASQIGYPVVLKAVSAALTHKSDVGAVKLGLDSSDAVRKAWHDIEANLAAHQFKVPLDGMLVAAQVRGGLEVVLGVHRDPEVGPTIMCGGGGILLELTKDVAFAAPPLNDSKATHLVGRTKLGKMLRGYRGVPPSDELALVAALVNLSRMVEALGDFIESVDINPFLVQAHGGGAVALDALIVLNAGSTVKAGGA